MKRIWLVVPVLLAAVLFSGASRASIVKEIRFAGGKSSAVIKQSVIRGENDQYFLAAKAGQKMDVEITALEKNAAVTIYRPGYKAGKDSDGVLEVQGATLTGAGEGEDATGWKGVLPESGRYLILVGPTRGNATYRLKVVIF
ncbi:MAG: hypothetical protein P4L43_13930 [Syntrophobacteraceae bacterium]|nr:hypothetical protein [Syntrophobacteraceae bacterium]